jgi:hypothetical protein
MLPHPKAEADGEVQIKASGFGFKSSYTQEIKAGYFWEGYYMDIPGSGYDDVG